MMMGKSSSSLSSCPYNVNLSWDSNSWNIEYHEVPRRQIWILRESLVQACVWTTFNAGFIYIEHVVRSCIVTISHWIS